MPGGDRGISVTMWQSCDGVPGFRPPGLMLLGQQNSVPICDRELAFTHVILLP